MNRRLFGYLLVAVLLASGLVYHFRLGSRPQPQEQGQTQAQGQTEAQPTKQAARAKAGESAAIPTVTESLELPVTDGRLLARLPNGLTVLVAEDKRFPLVAERLYVHAGSSYETKAQEGISHLLEHMVFNSTAKRPKGGVASDIEGVGGDTNAATSFDYTQYMADLPSEHWKLGLDVFQDMIFGARFLPEELEQEKKVVISELERGQDDPGQRLFKLSQALTWKGTPYEHPIIGSPETINAVTSQDLKDYIAKHYQPQSMLLVVVGDVDAQQVYREAQAVFGSLENDRTVTPPDTRDMPANTGGPVARAVPGNWNTCYLRVSFAVPGLHSAKDVPLEVLSDLLGGGKTSKFYRKYVYELQLANDIDVSSSTLERGGMFTIDATLKQDKLEAFWAELGRDLATLKADRFTDEELDRAKLNIEDHLFRAKETIGGLATKLAYYQFNGYGPDGEANVVYDVRNVDRAQLQGLLTEYVQPGNAALSLLVPGKEQAQADALATKMLAGLKASWPAAPVAAQAAGQGGKASAPEVVELGGGHILVLQPDPTMPYASVTLAYRGGDGLLTPEEQGLSELVAKTLARSVGKRQAPEIDDFLGNRAASLGATAGRDAFLVSARYPSRFERDVLGLFGDAVLEPAFDPAELERAKKLQLAQIDQAADKPTSLAFRNIYPFLFPGSHYGYFRAGLPDTVAAFTREQARAYWEKQRSMPWVMSVCGVFDRKAVLETATRLAKAPAAKAPAIISPAWGAERSKVMKLPDRTQSHLFMVFPVEGRDSEDTAALEVLKTALAGQGGLLFQDLRDQRGLGYTVTAFLWQAPKAGFLAFYIGTTPDKTGEALEGFKRIAGQVAAKGLDKDELDRASNSIEGDYYQGHQSIASRSLEAAGNLIMDLPLNYDREMLNKVAALSPEQVAKVAAKYLDASKAYLFSIEP
ncbi:M16 family metallopeptidase [Fundidesulfovibrio agrisoli]|uniref:M16 family metallopeptidase n=1 Tax=Fundidesulfovibrio agrisoli TaxID=2922717 RepID=UPI001FADF3FB|nr:pitrilysin family protein [Fundidesulfovibrio agrisoli]